MTVTLRDPQSGSLVHVRTAQLPQECGFCRAQMQGHLIVSCEGDELGWTCHDHLERRLLSLPMTEGLELRSFVLENLDRLMETGDRRGLIRKTLEAT